MRRAALALLLAACGGKAPGPAPDPTSGPNAELVAKCNACHAEVAQRWANGPSHALLLDCASCHTQFLARPGPKHQTSRACGDCHSVLDHNAFDCPVCHEVHGSTNRFLVRETVQDKPIHFTAPEGEREGLIAVH